MMNTLQSRWLDLYLGTTAWSRLYINGGPNTYLIECQASTLWYVVHFENDLVRITESLIEEPDHKEIEELLEDESLVSTHDIREEIQKEIDDLKNLLLMY